MYWRRAVRTRENRVGVARGLVESQELLEDPAIRRRVRRRASRGALEEQPCAIDVAQPKRGEAGRVELEARGARRRPLEERFFLEERGERGGIVVRRDEAHARVAHGTDAAVELERALEGRARGVDLLEAVLEDARALDVEPRGELRVARVRVRHAREVRRERLLGGHVAVLGAIGELPLEPPQRARVVRRDRERALPSVDRRAAAGFSGRVQEARAQHEQLDARGVLGRRRELALEVLEHRGDVRPPVLARAEEVVRGRERRIDHERELRVRDRARVVAEARLARDRELEVRARDAELVSCGLERRDARGEKLHERLGAHRIEHRASPLAQRLFHGHLRRRVGRDGSREPAR